MNKSYSYGFTLIEIIVVVVIISIMAVLGLQMINSGSVERNLQQHGKILKATIEYSCDQATLQNIPYGIKFFKNGYNFSQFINQQWLEVISGNDFFNKELTDGSTFSLEIDDHVVVLNDEFDDIPQIMCDSSGELTTFSLIISDATNMHHYQLKTIDFWQLEGRWLDDPES
ncbi:MAG: prepilin-type N-terminal cleavage/methylation domain-containing protein [Alcanivoracaceae bacterium]|nr:prepilin-type N-terminal cleavage/methylation domain-containing protein [Alcanivoracaceae bacterium]